MNLYQTLNVERDATDEEIKQAYRKKARETHPDLGGSEKEFHGIARAYKILHDPLARTRYDTTGDEDGLLDKTSRAITLIVSILNPLFSSTDNSVFKMDVVAKLLEIIDKGLLKDNKTIHMTRKQVQRLRKLKKRFKYKGKREDVILMMLNKKMGELHRSISLLKEASEIAKIAKGIIEDYEFEVDDAELLIRFEQRVNFGTTTGTISF